MPWIYQGQPFEDPGEYFGFVYVITHNPTGRKYIGKKLFTSAGYKQVKGKRKKIRKESDWKDYWGSSPELQNDLLTLQKSDFTREIIRLCRTRSECTYYESKMILETDALLKDEYWNSWISCKITKQHLRALRPKDPTPALKNKSIRKKNTPKEE